MGCVPYHFLYQRWGWWIPNHFCRGLRKAPTLSLVQIRHSSVPHYPALALSHHFRRYFIGKGSSMDLELTAIFLCRIASVCVPLVEVAMVCYSLATLQVRTVMKYHQNGGGWIKWPATCARREAVYMPIDWLRSRSRSNDRQTFGNVIC